MFRTTKGNFAFRERGEKKAARKKVEIPKERIGGRIGTFPRVIFHWMASRNVYS